MIKDNLDITFMLKKLKSANPYIDEFTVFIIVKIPNLNEFSNFIPDIVNKLETAKSEIIKTKTVKKYLFTSDLSVFDFNKVTLFKYIWFGFVLESKLFKEYLSKLNILITLKPELVEKKDPPIITKIRKIKDKFEGIFSKEIPKFETLLDKETKIFKKLFSELKNIKKIAIIIIKYKAKYKSSLK